MTKQKEMANEREIVVGISNVNMKIGTNLAAITANAKPCVCGVFWSYSILDGGIYYMSLAKHFEHLRNAV